MLSLRRSGVRCHEPLTFRGGAGAARLKCRKRAALGGLQHSPGASPSASLSWAQGMELLGPVEVLERIAAPENVPGEKYSSGSSEQDPRCAAGSLLDAQGQAGSACSTASLPHSPLVSPSLSSMQSNLLNSPCPQARSVHFHDVSPLCSHAHTGAVPSDVFWKGQLPLYEQHAGGGRLLTSGGCDSRAGVSHRGLLTGKVCQERRELGLRERQGALKRRGQWGGWRRAGTCGVRGRRGAGWKFGTRALDTNKLTERSQS